MSNINIINGNFTLDNVPVGGDEWSGGTNYILVKAEGTDIENATELQAAYDLAISMSATAINRITIVAAPGYYNSDSDFNIDEEYIDLVSLDGKRSIVLNGNGTISITSTNTLVRGVDVLTKPFKIGDDLENLVIENCKGGDNSFGNTNDGTNLTINGKFIKCEGGHNSFGSRVIGDGTAILTVSGKFIDCVAGFRSFGAFNVPGIQNNPNITTLNITNAEFINCNAGPSSFGSGGNFFGLGSSIEIVGSKFINCKSSGQESFGYANHPGVSTLTINSSGNNDVQTVFENCEAFGPSFGSASSTVTNVVIGGNLGASSNPYRVIFKNCVSKFFVSSPPQLTGSNSFGGFGALNFVELINCRAGDNSFGLTISESRLENCIGGNNSFGKNGVSGIFINCKAGNSSFNDGLTNSSNVTGTFIDCTAGNNSFKANFNLNGNFRNCTASDNSFRNSTTFVPSYGVDGTFVNCIGGDNSFGSGNENVIGDFTNCTAGDNSFGGGLSGTSSGTFANCTGGDNSFASSEGTASGTFTNCTGGDNSFASSGGTTSGIFTNCIGGGSSFGGGGTLTGKVYYCRLTNGEFETPTGSGQIVLSIDGNDDVINSSSL